MPESLDKRTTEEISGPDELGSDGTAGSAEERRSPNRLLPNYSAHSFIPRESETPRPRCLFSSSCHRVTAGILQKEER
jgi:hypothetical protein